LIFSHLAQFIGFARFKLADLRPIIFRSHFNPKQRTSHLVCQT